MSHIIFTVINDLTYDQRMKRICGSLCAAGHTVLLIGRQLKSSLPISEEEYRQYRLKLFFTKGKLFYLEYNIRLFFFLWFQRFDIICGIDLDTILPCYFSAKFKRKLCVYDAHELFTEVPEVIRRPAVQKIWSWVEGFAIGRIKNCYTVSDGLAHYFFLKYDRKFQVIRNVPILQEKSLIAATKEDPYLFYQGALNEGRGLEQLIAAMADIPLKLIVAGEGDLSDALRKQVTEQHLTHKVRFMGQLQPEALRPLTAGSYLGVNLLENKGLSYFYSLANKFFDYVHAGVPVVTMNFPEYRKLNEQYEVAVLLDDLRKETITSGIESLANNKDAYFRLRENCLQARHEWNWQEEEQKLLAFYRALQ